VVTWWYVYNRINDASAIEQRLLELAHTTDAKLTAPALAYFAPCSIEDAGRVLDDLAARDRLSMDIEDDGTVVYHLLGRQKITAARPVSETRSESLGSAPSALVPISRSPSAPSPLLAAALSALVPGAGHIYAGRLAAAFLWFIVVGIGYTLLLPGLVLHLFSIASAAAAARRFEPPRSRWLLAA
jgi:hypothetical protein